MGIDLCSNVSEPSISEFPHRARQTIVKDYDLSDGQRAGKPAHKKNRLSRAMHEDSDDADFDDYFIYDQAALIREAQLRRQREFEYHTGMVLDARSINPLTPLYESYTESRTSVLSLKQNMPSVNDSQYTSFLEVEEFEESVVKRIQREDIRLIYKFEHEIGSGFFGGVRIAHRPCNPQLKYAIKSIKRDRVEANLSLLEQELNILLSVDHPYIVKFYECFLDHKYVHLVMEHCEGGDLAAKILRRQKIPEDEARVIIKQSLNALRYLHGLNIAHRDFKPENVLFQQGSVKLIDFGISKMLTEKRQQMHDRIGTAWYVAPEVLERRYDKRCDLWSVGVVTYVLLSGNLPFCASGKSSLNERIRTADYSFASHEWQNLISQDAKSFIQCLLEPNVGRRMTLEQALAHPWIKDVSLGVASPDMRTDAWPILRLLLEQKGFNQLTSVLRQLLLSQLSQEDLEKNTQAFELIDESHSGSFNMEQLSARIDQLFPDQSLKLNYSPLVSQGGSISYTEFLCLTLTQDHLSQENLSIFFDSIDTDKLGYLTAHSFRKAFKRGIRNLNQLDIETMLSEAGLRPNSKISRHEFIALLRPDITINTQSA